ncbi:hypothetical protein BDV41DRAFT_565685 [Aspergillus transmontanensis]|uniref:FAD-binding domain-containing protein n=1 Tax=Aspergillus transmontanensis TaxID=1034304 RepID=A0A5N6VSF9_9EURO|nr:hypothetical protein BDV41DRAFT_565685 [Aspergillus transmontanensis]
MINIRHFNCSISNFCHSDHDYFIPNLPVPRHLVFLQKTNTTNVKHFRVIIVGSSIAGLTLAHSLQQCGTDFVVLEANTNIAPQAGASIGILTNGARTLDQLGIYLILNGSDPQLTTRNGYPVTFLDRQVILRILFSQLGEHQNRVHLNKKVVRVENLPNKVMVHCGDGSAFEGDLVVGADGVRSTVREEIWRHMESLGLPEYSCVFGISNPTAGVHPEDAHRTYAEGCSTLTIGGKGDHIYWFLLAKMDQSSTGSDIPRFNEQDLENHVAKYLHIPITSTNKAYPCLEEAFYQYWSVDRCVCIGDSMHRRTRNIGQAGNSAIETAVSLVNCLASLIEQPEGQDLIALEDWQKARQPRAKKILTLANDILVKGEMLEFLPLPARTLQGTMPYVRQPDQAETTLVRIVKRVLSCFLLVGLFAYVTVLMGSLFEKVSPMALLILRKGS